MLVPDESDVQMREAVIRVEGSEFSDLGLEEFGLLCGEAGIRGVTQFVCTGPGGIMAVQVERPFDEERLSALEHVPWWERVEHEAGVVLLEVEIPDVPDTATPHHELGVSNQGITLTDHGFEFSLVGPQESITQIMDESTEAGVSMELRALSDYRGSRDVLDSLTDRQYEIVRTTYEMGYYEVPRAVSIAEVAAELELDPSTVSEHLQRAERNLLTQLLGAD
jgi:DNA-binding CsgD family transcriptional regulator